MNDILLYLERIIYIFLILSPIIIFANIFLRLKKKFFALRAWEFDLKQEMILLEVRNPKELAKTPEAMELVLSSFYNASGESNWYSKRWLGKARPKYSLEIVSIDGNVRFFIWARKGLKKLIESSFYSQYPTVEIIEVPDYVRYFSWEEDAKGGLFGVEYKLTKADPIPIKTYKHFHLDKAGQKAEEIIDPVSFLVETLGNVGKGENFWLQFVIRAQKKDIDKPKGFFRSLFGLSAEKTDWKTTADEQIQELKDSLMEEGENGVKFQKVTTDKEKEVIQAIIENVNKPSYWVGIRTIYFAKDGMFDAGQITPTLSLFNVLNSSDFNTFGIAFNTGFDFPWHDPNGKRAKKLKKRIFSDYKKRYFFEASKKESKVWPDKKRYQTAILSVEELATIFHPPTGATATPSFERIESKKGSAPANLPI